MFDGCVGINRTQRAMSGESSSNQGGETEERKICANGGSVQTETVEAKLDAGNIDEAESALREGLSLNSEVGFFY